MENKKQFVVKCLLSGFAFVLGLCFGALLGQVTEKDQMWRAAQEKGYAWHARKDGAWAWKSFGEVRANTEEDVTNTIDLNENSTHSPAP